MNWHKKAMSNAVMVWILIAALALVTFGLILYGLQKKLAPLSP
ncbi:MAG TPA: hypothetical protein VJB13_03775 [Candidatus Nanoarchaeia archaeon]|nr:hypothetical protein [Candidatus Nanoarchaeia archaeon]